MACTWRIRHKLMLGMALVVSIMALLLGGTLYGLASYRGAMGTCVHKFEELKDADRVKGCVFELSNPPSDPGKHAGEIQRRIEGVTSALEQYEAQLNRTVDSGRAPNGGRNERFYVDLLRKDMDDLRREIQSESARLLVFDGGPIDLFAACPSIKNKLDRAKTNAEDLVSELQRVINESQQRTREDARKSIWFLAITGVIAILLMAGNLRFFYRWVAQPIRDLEQGVSRVARGDFQQHIEINSGDEIEDLAKAYNEMTAKLRAMYENLADQVNERSRQLVRSERLAGVGFLAAGVAHEINNPLASIAFCSESLESRLQDLMQRSVMSTLERETIAKYLKMIQEEAFRCKEITQKLLAFSRNGELKFEQTDLVEVIQGVLDMVQHLQNSKGKRIDFRPLGPILAWVNAQEIKQVFLNLVVNALENMDDGGILSITHGLRDGQIELLFKDSGCGMTPDVLENIFEPFFTRSRTGKGTGLGLSISHRIVNQHGGEIEASSAGAGLGSTFTVRLPMRPPANPSEMAAETNDPVQEFLKLNSAKRPLAA